MNDKDSNIQYIDDEISFKELIIRFRKWVGYLLSKWLIIVLLSLTGSVLGFFYSKNKKPIYTATTTFVLEEGDKSNALGSLGGLASIAGIDLGGGGGGIFQGDNIIELYRSRNMIVKTLLSTINGELIIDKYIKINKLREKWKDNPKLNNLSFTANEGNFSVIRLRDSILNDIAEEIDKNYLLVNKPDKKLSIIKVDVKSNDEFFAKSFNEKIVENVNDFYVATRTKKSAENVAILQEKTDSVRRIMKGEIYKMAEISDLTPNLNPTRQVQRAAPIQQSQFSAETNKAVLGELVKNLEMSKISLLKDTPLIQVIDMPIYPLDKKEISLPKGMLFGCLIFGVMSVACLTIRRIVLNSLNS